MISIHAPAWGATDILSHPSSSHPFQSTLPRGERLGGYIALPNAILFQSTLPRGERRYKPRKHTLAGYFNPRSRVGSDRIWVWTRPQRNDFNPRSRVGSDSVKQLAAWLEEISIHAPAWGATQKGGTGNEAVYNFNPRSRVGSDITPAGVKSGNRKFQSTLPRGERLHFFRIYILNRGFQSTLPRGERPRSEASNITRGSFQSTLPRGERR